MWGWCTLVKTYGWRFDRMRKVTNYRLSSSLGCCRSCCLALLSSLWLACGWGAWWETEVWRLAHGAPRVALWPGIRLSMLETWETQAPALGREGPLEEGAAAHARVLAWRIPCAEGPGGLQSVESQSQTRQSTHVIVLRIWKLRTFGHSGEQFYNLRSMEFLCFLLGMFKLG